MSILNSVHTQTPHIPVAWFQQPLSGRATKNILLMQGVFLTVQETSEPNANNQHLALSSYLEKGLIASASSNGLQRVHVERVLFLYRHGRGNPVGEGVVAEYYRRARLHAPVDGLREPLDHVRQKVCVYDGGFGDVRGQ